MFCPHLRREGRRPFKRDWVIMGILLQGTLRYWIFALRNVALMRLAYVALMHLAYINTVNNLKIHLDRSNLNRLKIYHDKF